MADGTCLAAIEPGDLYALFSNLLDQAIDAAAQQQNDRRMIDLLVCRRQGFAVINVIGPALSGSQSDHGRRHSYELKVARRACRNTAAPWRQNPAESCSPSRSCCRSPGDERKNTACFLCKMYKERAAFFVPQKPNIPPEIPLFANLLPEI